ncbi:MAG: BrnT family toxin [Sulfuricellaceae bacterium]|nr:BrnT family toxin [Sulfuricellaceae bacterium]
MSAPHFEWDEHKATANLKKHGISFEEAKSVFYDENAKLIGDPDHSEDEDRFVLLGLNAALKVLVVCHCYRNDSGAIRIISARKATAKEKKSYI